MDLLVYTASFDTRRLVLPPIYDAMRPVFYPTTDNEVQQRIRWAYYKRGKRHKIRYEFVPHTVDGAAGLLVRPLPYQAVPMAPPYDWGSIPLGAEVEIPVTSAEIHPYFQSADAWQRSTGSIISVRATPRADGGGWVILARRAR